MRFVIVTKGAGKMGIRLCDDDPVVKELRGVFRANILRIPETRIQPLSALLCTRSGVRFLGDIRDVLEGVTSDVAGFEVKQSDMATLKKRQSRGVDGEIAAQILSGLLDGIGEGRAPDLSAQIKGVGGVHFAFPSPTRFYVDIAQIGRLLAGSRITSESLLLPEMLNPKNTIRVVDSVVTCDELEISASQVKSSGVSFNARSIADQLLQARLAAELKNSGELSIRANKRLTFAFTCVTLTLNDSGEIRELAPSSDQIDSPRLVSATSAESGQQSHVLLSRVPEMITIHG